MGRIADLFGEVAAAAEDGPEGLVLEPGDWERLRAEWSDQDVEDALVLVRENLLQGELVEAADSLSARLIELLGEYGDAAAFARAVEGGARLDADLLAQLARRVDRLEEALEIFRDGAPPDRRGFDALRRRLADRGLEPDGATPPDGDGV